jgi:hypothetical protein
METELIPIIVTIIVQYIVSSFYLIIIIIIFLIIFPLFVFVFLLFSIAVCTGTPQAGALLSPPNGANLGTGSSVTVGRKRMREAKTSRKNRHFFLI